MFARTIVFLFVFSISLKAQATNYYLSVNGNDNNSGLSQGQAWKTINRLNNHNLQPGDVITFGPGQFQGTIRQLANECGTNANPITFKGASNHSTMITPNGSHGLISHCGNLKVEGFSMMGQGFTSYHWISGIFVHNNMETHQISNIHIKDNIVSNFPNAGIFLRGKGSFGVSNVFIENNIACYNKDIGIRVRADVQNDPNLQPHQYPNQNIHITSNIACHNDGRPMPGVEHTGSGIIVAQTNNAFIMRNEAFENGKDDTPESGGPVGIWTWDSNAVFMFHNISHHNHGGGVDGGGFDFDGAVRNSVMAYNISHNNDGPGYLHYQYGGAPRNQQNNIIAYNISYNDGGNQNTGALLVGSGDNSVSGPIYIFNNTFITKDKPNKNIANVKIHERGLGSVNLYNNIFIHKGNEPIVSIFDYGTSTVRADINMLQNIYYNPTGNYQYIFRNTTSNSLGQFRNVAGVENFFGQNYGFQQNPGINQYLSNPSTPYMFTVDQLKDAARQFLIRPANSPALLNGINPSQFGLISYPIGILGHSSLGVIGAVGKK